MTDRPLTLQRSRLLIILILHGRSLNLVPSILAYSGHYRIVGGAPPQPGDVFFIPTSLGPETDQSVTWRLFVSQ
ncbi:hypothetical protein F4801DRAFT_541133 [Xylaria longipes]|nr:hypothetical protein F4801DRAFT_541133 [Xylaria longipes]